MKILYSIGKKKSGGIQLSRFLRAIKGQHTVKVAAFRETYALPYRDWTLDALLNVFNPKPISFNNDNLEVYYQQVKYFDPDLIISDIEFFSSYIATLLNKPIIQVSSRLAYDGIQNKVPIGVKSSYKYIFGNCEFNDLLKNATNNSDLNLAYSPLCDIKEPPKFRPGFQWIRPYHVLGKPSIPSQHQIVGVVSHNRRDVLRLLKRFDDAVLFTPYLDEQYSGVILKDAMMTDEYASNLKNAGYFVHQGQQDYLADSFYNGKYCLIMPDFTDDETVINALLAEHYKLAQIVYDPIEPLRQLTLEETQYDPSVKYLHEMVTQL